MLALYLAALGFGLTVLAASAMFGAKDSDGGGHEVGGHDDVADHGADHALGSDFLRVGATAHLLSLRFWTFALAAFGATGTLATLFAPEGAGPFVFVAALLTGSAVGLGASALFRSLQRETVSGETTLSDFAGEEGKVLLPIRPGGRGTIRVARESGSVELVAITRDAAPIPAGADVLVASVKDGVADVTLVRPTDELARRAAVRTSEPG